ncbi:MAG TPA: DNA polymerase III subunit gamma/tau, partial [Chitinophagaceae bacterium]|nr:DNA polymerase III subunit gamma/tau [Chitinophagaceae bacterium]
EKHKILPTILSRCQIFDFKRITTDDTVEHLEEICKKEHIKAEKAALQIIAQKSEGCMRDALSILDKIVSFTNGELNYANTLEHLNILDADYYFRLLECMLQQDLSGAMLLYDDINQKGFEGDLVLNGFAEFIRNLLVCKDEKAAALLDVVESFRGKYMEMAGKVEAPLLISALNILNNAEINYKAARNKKLHVELALIRLCYLQQAVELAGNADPGKKKVTETAKPVAFRQITSFSTKEIKSKKVTDEAKLVIDSSYASAPAEVREEKTDYTKPTPQQPAKTGKLSALDKIRKQYKESNGNGNNDHNHPLEIQTLQNAWAEYVKKLKAAKNPAVQPFELAILRINDESSFEAVTANSIEKQFIEQERNSLFDFLQKKLQNKMLQFSVIIEEKNEERPQTEQTLSAKEQYLKLAEQYPAIKDLKDKLKLELDY